jgi:hypothetical protein
MQDTAKQFQCRHIRTSGRRCGSPSMRAEHFCYYHRTSRRPPDRAEAEAIAAGYPIEPAFTLPPLEDRAAVLLALSETLNRVTANKMDRKLAGIVLYGLQIAASVLPKEPRPATRQSDAQPASAEELIDELTVDPIHGVMAPIAELPDPQLLADQKSGPSNIVVGWLQKLGLEKEKYEEKERARAAAVLPNIQAAASRNRLPRDCRRRPPKLPTTH